MKSLLEKQIFELKYEATKVAKEKQKQRCQELDSSYKDPDSWYENENFKSKVEALDKEEQAFLRSATGNFSLRMLHNHGQLDTWKYLGLNKDLKELEDKEFNPRAYNIDQREAAIVDSDCEIGTTNIQQCVVVIIISENEKTALAHFDRFTTKDSLKQIIEQNFDSKKASFHVYGARSLSELQQPISQDNIVAVLETLRDVNANIKELYIPDELTSKLKDIMQFSGEIKEPSHADIVFKNGSIHTNEQPNRGYETLPIRILSRRLEYIEKEHDYLSTEITRDSELRMLNIKHCEDLEKYVKHNNIKYSITKNDVFEELFKLEEKYGKDVISYYDIYDNVIPFYDSLLASEQIALDKRKEQTPDTSDLTPEEAQLIILLNKMTSEDIIKCIETSNKKAILLHLSSLEQNKTEVSKRASSATEKLKTESEDIPIEIKKEARKIGAEISNTSPVIQRFSSTATRSKDKMPIRK